MVNVTKLRQKMEKVLFVFISFSIAGFLTVKTWSYIERSLEKARVNKRMLQYKKFTEEGGSDISFEMSDYFTHIKRFINNIVVENKPRRAIENIGINDGRMKGQLYSLGLAISDYKTIFKVISTGDGGSIPISVAINRFFGGNLFGFHERSAYWMKTDRYKYFLQFKPPGFDNIRLELKIGNDKKVMDLNAHIVLVMLQYVSEAY